MLNKLLHRQIRKALGDFDALPEKYKGLFNAISESYDFYEKDRRMMERSIELSSDEMIGLYRQLKKETDETIQKSEANLEIKNIELERKNKELEQFAYVASHDLQEPLRTTSSFVELLQQQYQDKLDEKASKYLSFIAQSSDRMKVLIKDLLDYSRIGRKKELSEVDCNMMLNDVLDDLGAAITDAGAKIKREQLPVVSGYPTEIKQLFQNLIINSIKFRKKNVPLQIELAARKNNGHWEFTCTDNGIGIDKEHSERIFIIFQRLHTRNEYEGSGIGLSHCKKIVELHGGQIWIESIPGKGSTFYFTIPQNNS
jgi:light-regulated signal transduction histidine kinase (bacteriophytochrome)